MLQADIAEDFPQPLTPTQRHAIERETLRLQRLRKRSSANAHDISTRLRLAQESAGQTRLKINALNNNANPPTAEVGAWGEAAAAGKRPRDEAQGQCVSSDAAPQAPAPPPARKSMFRLKSAAFGAMQGFMSAASKEAMQSLDLVKTREAINKATQLAMLTRDLENAEREMESLHRQAGPAQERFSTLNTQWLRYSCVLEAIEEAESAYCAAFFLHATGGPVDEAGNVVAPYDIFFCPAAHTDESKEIVLGQIDEALDAYLAFRALVDPLLLEITAREFHENNSKNSPGHAKQASSDDWAHAADSALGSGGSVAVLPVQPHAALAFAEDVVGEAPPPQRLERPVASELDDFED